jgi:hypothetical protein
VFWSVEKMMGSLYTFPRRLFWRRWQSKLCKLSQHFFFDSVRELSDSSGIMFMFKIYKCFVLFYESLNFCIPGIYPNETFYHSSFIYADSTYASIYRDLNSA